MLTRRAALAGLLATGLGACTDVEFLVANLPARIGPYRRHADIPYGAGPRRRLDVYEPAGPPRGAPGPVVVFWHGGRWEEGEKEQYRFVGEALAELGCVAILPNYRHYPEVRMAGFMEDAAAAAAWAAAYARERHDGRRFFLMGHSAGAHIATLVALDLHYYAAVGAQPPQVAGVIGLSGPYDFLPFHDNEGDLKDMFGPPADYRRSQPISFVTAAAPPMLLVHGRADRTVAPYNTTHLAAALREHGVPVEVRLYEGLRHADTIAALSKPARWRAPVLADIGAFVGHAAT